MGAFAGDYSRAYPGMYDQTKRYVGMLPQQSSGATKRPVVDADLLDHLLSQTHLLRSFIEEVLGSGSPNDGFNVEEAAVTANNFKLSLGQFYNNGLRCNLVADTDYLSAAVHPNDIHPRSTTLAALVLTDTAANYPVNDLVGRLIYPDAGTLGTSFAITANTATTITIGAGDMTALATVGDNYIVGLTTPGGARTDLVYLDSYLDEWDENEDANLIHTISGSPYVTANRLKIIQCVKVRENSVVMPTNGNDSNGNYHWYEKLAEIDRTAVAAITTAIITDFRLDIKRAFYQVPTLDVGGGYGDVVDGGLSISATGVLETDGTSVFDNGIEVNDIAAGLSDILINIEPSVDYATFVEEAYIQWGDPAAGHAKFGLYNTVFKMTSGGLVLTPELIGVGAADGGLYIDVTAGNGLNPYIQLDSKNATHTGRAKIHFDAAVEPNLMQFEIREMVGVFTDAPTFLLNCFSGTEVVLNVDGQINIKTDMRLGCDEVAMPGSDKEISFVGDGSVVDYPYLKWVSGSDRFELNYSLFVESPDDIPTIGIVAPNVANKRATDISMTVGNAVVTKFEHRICCGIDADATIITDGKCNITNFLIIEGGDEANTPAFRFMSKRVGPTYNTDDLELVVFGDVVSHGDYLKLGQQWTAKAGANSFIQFYADATLVNGLIEFDGSAGRFMVNEDFRVYKNRSGESTGLEVSAMADETAYLQLHALSGGGGAGQNIFRVYSNENILLGVNSDANYVSFASRWDDADYGATGASVKNFFHFENRTTADVIRNDMTWLFTKGYMMQTGNYAVIGKGTTWPNAFISFGEFDIDVQTPDNAKVYIEANPDDGIGGNYNGSLRVGSNGSLYDTFLLVTGHLNLLEYTDNDPTTPLDGDIWVKNNTVSGDGELWFRSNGANYRCTATLVP